MRTATSRFAGFLKFVALMVCTSAAVASAQAIQISPASVNFGSLAQGTKGNPWTLTVNNTSGKAVSLGTISLSDSKNFAETNNCGASLSAFSNCNIQVAFTPNTTGALTATLNVPNGDVSSPQGVALAGNGTAAGGSGAAQPVLSPTAINFGSQTLHTSSNSWTATLNNQGAAALSVNSITVSDPADFSLTTDCGSSVSAFGNCHINVVFTPNTVGNITGSVLVNDSVGIQSIALNGQGTAAAASVLVEPTAVDFGQQAVGVVSNAETVTVNNTGSSSVSLGGYAISPAVGFSVTSTTCTAVLAANSTCTFTLTFTPAVVGAVDATMTSSAGGAPLSLPLHGTGISNNATVIFSPSSVDFGTIAANTTSGAWTISVSNTSSVAAVFLQPLALSGSSAFSMTTTCGTTLAAHASCNVLVTFAPTSAGQYTGQIAATVQGSTSAQTITLAGNATSSTRVVQLSPSAVDFGAINVGSSSNAWTVNVSNPTGAAVAFTNPIAIAGSAAFSMTTNCGMSLAAYSSCSISVSFAPRGLHPTTGQIVANVAGGNVQTVSLNGTGTGTLPTPSLQVSPLVVNFGTVNVGAAIADQVVTITNAGIYDAAFTSPISLTGAADFSIDANNCPTTLTGGASCTLSIKYAPAAPETATGEVLMTAASLTDPLTVALNATAVIPDLQLSASALNFGTVALNVASPSQAVTITNPGGSTGLNVGLLQNIGPSQFSIVSTTCGAALGANSFCVVNVVFQPTASGVQNAALVVTAANTGKTQSVSVTGTGSNPLPLLVPSVTSMDWGPVQIGTNTTRTVSVTNEGAASVQINMNVPHTSGYTLQSTTCGTLAVNASCSATVNFSPGAIGVVQGMLIFAVNGANYQVNVPLQAEADALVFPTSASFADTNVNSTNIALLIVNNPTGYTPSWMYSLTGPFTVTGGTCPASGGTVGGYSSCSVIVTFAPTSAGAFSGAITYVESGVTHIVTLSGNGVGVSYPTSNGLFTVSSNPVDFGTVTYGVPVTKVLTITNNYGRAIQITSPGPSDQWAMTAGNCASIAVGGSCQLSLTMTPTQVGPASTYFLITSPGHTQYTFEYLSANVVAAPNADFTMAVTPQSMNLASGQTGQAAFTLTPNGGYTGSVSLACDGLPMGVSCTFAPATLTADGKDTVQTSTLTVQTTGIYGGQAMNHSERGFTLAALGIFPAFLLLGVFGMRKRIRIMPLMVLIALVTVLGGAVGCGAGMGSSITPVGITQVKVTATAMVNGKASGATQSTTFTLNITK